MKCCVIFVMALLVVLLAEASAAPPRARHLQRRYQRVRYVPKYAMRRNWQDNPDCTPSGEEVVVADDPPAAILEVASPLISEDPVNELDAPIVSNQDAAPEAVTSPPSPSSADEEADDEDDEVSPPTKGSKRPAQAWPHTFFPMNFGKTFGGSIAVANSYSTAKGSAISHAISYGGGMPNREV